MADLVTVKAEATDGIHPKVITPALAGVVIGLLLMLFVDRDTGLTVLLAALGLGGVGAAAPAGHVKVQRASSPPPSRIERYPRASPPSPPPT